MTLCRPIRFQLLAATLLLVASAGVASATVRVQDVAKLKGQRTNQLSGFGLVIGLNGTGDGGKYATTLRALAALHRKYEQPVLNIEDLIQNANVAMVMVSATIPEFGGREGQTLDVQISAIGPATSLAGGTLITTPLQDATLSVQDIFAMASGRIDIPDPNNPNRGLIRDGATLERDLFYHFIEGGYVTLVLDDHQAGWPLAHAVAGAVNHTLAMPVDLRMREANGAVRQVTESPFAVAIDPKNVRVRIPTYELRNPSLFIKRVLEAEVFDLPEAPARVVINRRTHQIAVTGNVTISPTLLHLPGAGTIAIGQDGQPKPSDFVGLDTENAGGVDFQELLNTLSLLRLSPEQMVAAVERLKELNTLHAQVLYTE